MRILFALTLAVTVNLVTRTIAADVFLRWNQAGYRPERNKVVIAMSESDLTGQAWQVVEASNHVVLSGEFSTSVAGIGDHTPLPFNHAADLGAVTTLGEYTFRTGSAEPATFRIAPDPYASLRALPLRHLRVMRSGTNDVLLRQPSHLLDAQAPMWIPDGDPANGKWKPAEPARTVDALGGWYDAGDQIKFTLNIAYTTYHLLLAYRLSPGAHGKTLSTSDLPDILDEARHGLDFLMRVYPEPDVFIIQVGDERDHDQPARLPEDDAFDGQRPALCALSRPQMGAAAAALALGARTWHELGRDKEAAHFASMAGRIFDRALKPDTLPVAFERGAVNDFYRDPTDADQMALAAAELRRLREPIAVSSVPPAGEVSWAAWNWLANAAAAEVSKEARTALLQEADGYARHAAGPGQPWGLPSRYGWGSLHRWIGAANAARYAEIITGPNPAQRALFHDILDYTFGRNNWGVSFLFSEELPNTVRNIYSPAYHLLDVFPTGALSEGPGSRRTHDSLRQYFNPPEDDPLARFNTAAAVFVDDSSDFMCQESTIAGQADIVLMLTLAAID